MINIHREVVITVDEVIEELDEKSRRLEFILQQYFITYSAKYNT
jgi:hypothetical protein